MSSVSFIESAGLLVSRDDIDVQHIRLKPGVPARIRRFQRLIREVTVASHDTPDIAAVRLVALDAIRPECLRQVAPSLRSLYTWCGLTHVEWQDDTPPRLERRALSELTIAAIRQQGLDRSSSIDLTEALARWLAASRGYSSIPAIQRPLELARDALCWWYQCLPMALFFHVSGLQPLSAVARVCLAREQTGLVPIVPMVIGDAAAQLMDVDSAAELLDAAAMSTGSDESGVVLRQALDLMEARPGESDSATLRRWVVDLLTLRVQAMHAGPISALLLAWLIDTCESGTIREEDPSRETPKKYFSKAADPLRLKLKDFPDSISRWPIELLDLTYRELIDDELSRNPGGSSARTLASALTNFHAFLVEWFDVSQLRQRLHNNVPLASVRAHVVWPEELGLAFGWTGEVTDDPQVRTTLRIILCVARQAAFRASEVLYLRLANIRDHTTFLEIELAPSLRWGRLKTRAAQRRLRIDDPYTMALIRSWVAERRSEGAQDEDLLFADPLNRSIVYRRHLVSTLVGSLLKAATGCADTVGHDLRHTQITSQNGDVVASSALGDVGRLSDNATGYGHVSGMTSLVSYTHLYEIPLRTWLDAAMCTLLTLNSSEVAAVTPLSPENLRQRASRLSTTSSNYAWRLLREPEQQSDYPAASSLWTWKEAAPPRPRKSGHYGLTVSISLLALGELAKRASDAEVARRFNLPEAEVTHLRANGITVAHDITRHTWPGKYDIRRELPMGLEKSLDLAKVDLQAALQQKAKFQKLGEWLSLHQDLKVLSQAYSSWRECRVGDHLSLDVPGRVIGLLKLLKAAEVNPQALRLCFRPAAAQPADADSALSRAERDFVAVFGIKPRLWKAESRDWDASIYLLWDSDDCTGSPTGASGMLDGLEAWMYATGVHCATWSKGDSEEAGRAAAL